MAIVDLSENPKSKFAVEFVAPGSVLIAGPMQIENVHPLQLLALSELLKIMAEQELVAMSEQQATMAVNVKQ